MKLLKYTVRLVIFLLTINLGAQNKKTYFFNENFNPLTASDFNKLTRENERFEVSYELDTAFIEVSYKTVLRGQLSNEDFESLKTKLKQNSKEIFKSDSYIVIDFNPGFLNCNNSNKGYSGWNIYDRDYLKKLNKVHPTNHFWIYRSQSKEELKYHHSDRIDWIEDPENIVEKLFFTSAPNTCYGVVMISINGTYISYHNEFSKETVWKYTEELTKLSKTNNLKE